MISIVIPSCTNEHLARLLESIEVSSPGLGTSKIQQVMASPNYRAVFPWVYNAVPSIVIGDNGLSDSFREEYAPKGISFVTVHEPFIFARAINSCVATLPPEHDILILNDDAIITSPNFEEDLTRLLSKPRTRRFGIVSLKLSGGVAGNREQMEDVAADDIVLTRRTVCFIAVVIRREVWNQIGGMDESFVGYGFEDTDYCRRAVNAGWLLGITGAASIEHGFGTSVMSSTFRRKHGTDGHSHLYIQNHNIFKDKWGEGPQLGDYETMPIVCDDSEEPLSSGTSFGLKELRSREQFTAQAPMPDKTLGLESDLEADAELLWAITSLVKPQTLIELGTREGVSTRILVLAAQQAREEAKIITIDPDSTCADFIQDLDCEFYSMKAEDFLAGLSPEKREALKADMLFIDTDPHDYQQTLMWLNTWVSTMLRPGGCALFHDVVSNRPEIQVRAAVESWVHDHTDWEWIVFPVPEKEYKWAQGGLGLLWAPE